MQRQPMYIVRLKRELEKILKNPPSGISLFPKEDSTDVLDASVMGMEGTPYESGVFKLEMEIPEKYPHEPPRVRFTTRVYHPNVDDAGRICLDLLKLPPKGSWRPVNTLEGLLIAIQQLLTHPNPDDPLMVDIADEYRSNRSKFDETARDWTRKYAFQTFENKEKLMAEDATDMNTLNGCDGKSNKLKRKDHQDSSGDCETTPSSKCSKIN